MIVHAVNHALMPNNLQTLLFYYASYHLFFIFCSRTFTCHFIIVSEIFALYCAELVSLLYTLVAIINIPVLFLFNMHIVLWCRVHLAVSCKMKLLDGKLEMVVYPDLFIFGLLLPACIHALVYLELAKCTHATLVAATP